MDNQKDLLHRLVSGSPDIMAARFEISSELTSYVSVSTEDQRPALKLAHALYRISSTESLLINSGDWSIKVLGTGDRSVAVMYKRPSSAAKSLNRLIRRVLKQTAPAPATIDTIDRSLGSSLTQHDTQGEPQLLQWRTPGK